MEFGLITFRSHACDKQLDMEFYQMMTPILNKADKYVVAIESPLTPEAHYHIMLSFKGDVTHLKQKFKTKAWTNWIANVNTTMTIIRPTLDEHALQVKKVGKTEEDQLKTLGYVCKENVVKTKGFDDSQITQAVKFYHTCERKAPKVDNSWRVLNVKTVIPYMEKVAKQHEIPPHDKSVFYYMAKEKMFVDLSNKTKDNIRTTLEIAYEEQDQYGQKVLEEQLNGSEILDSDYNQKVNNLYEANRRLIQFHKYCKDKIPDFNMVDLDGY